MSNKENVAIEDIGLDVIAEADRKGKPSDLFMPWFAANISVLGMSWGAWVLGFGLSFVQAVIVTIVGVALSFLFCGIIATLGKKGSAPTLALSRAAFGYNGNRISALISWMLTVGWETVLCVLATLATATVMEALGWTNHTTAQILGFVIVVGCSAFAGIFGFDTIMRVQTWITWLTAILTIIYLALTIPSINWTNIMAMPSGSLVSVIGAFVMLLTGFGLGWVNAAADYSRYLPRQASTKGVVFWTTFSSSLPCIVLAIFGVLLVGSDKKLGELINNDPIGALTTILPTWFLVPFAIVAILGLVGGIIMDLYSSGLSLLATGLRVPRPVATGIDAAIMTVGTILVVFFASDFLAPFSGFLTTLGAIIAAWAGIMIAEAIMRKKEYDEESLFTPSGIYGSINWEAIALVVVGTFVGWGLVVNSTSWLSWQGYLLDFGLGGREGAWAYSNIGILLSLAIGLFGHLLLGRSRVAKQEAQLD
ncbi:cytosine permease [Actinomyces sp. zg-332]|uniref:purine-cytosine permease family protein n=1 Tax=Actinomyces sp. zg-332 TaxID=2708340 RepID=UPI0014221239|nr:cytosine permease [Actinomyces sp. zg-332]QPK93672.1 cytosine permease [Actinomyces sp. zg-332]